MLLIVLFSDVIYKIYAFSLSEESIQYINIFLSLVSTFLVGLLTIQFCFSSLRFYTY
jgi:hypothetical protein